MLKKFIRIVGGDPNAKDIEGFSAIAKEINDLEAPLAAQVDAALASVSDNKESQYQALKEFFSSRTQAFKQRLQDGEEPDDLLPEAFAAVREASKRTIGLRHFDVQLIGGIALHSRRIAEMRTGEGKTLVATLPMYLNALTGKGVHLVTVNDYLARRDARWMGPIFDVLGLSVGVLQMAARTENGKKAFLVDRTIESPHEDQHQLRMVDRREAYLADIVYGTNSEFGFDYLRDNMTFRLEDRVQRGHFYAIIDEVDNILIDEARTPLIISGPAQDESEWYLRFAQIVKQLRPEDYEVDEKSHTVNLTDAGEMRVEELLGLQLRDPDRPEDPTPEQVRMLGYLEQCLRAQYLYRRNKDYLVQGGKVVIVDEFTGRLMPGRRWSDGLHQAVEAKEGVKVETESVTYATITIQNYFRMYEKLAGMTGTALTEAEEFDKIYKLGVLPIPTNLDYSALQPESELGLVETKDEKGYRLEFYTARDDTQKEPVYWKRQDFPDVVYRSEEAKLRALAREILRYHVIGRPVLVGTTSVELSERVSSRLRAEPLRRLTQVMLLRDAYVTKFSIVEDGRQINQLQFLHQPLDKLEVDRMRRLSRDLGMPFNPDDPANQERLAGLLEIPRLNLPRLVSDLQGGIPHQVLNARRHAEESQIIAGAGAFGAVTIATNMAGRGVDIKLGGELAEELMSSVNRVLARNGYPDAYDMNMEERRQALLAIGPENYGIYGSEINFYLAHMNDMELVRALGGLHVIGSERHEARRIDNQLRGRSARQGDPGSSRFYLSMEDYLMRVQGGDQANALMQRFKIDDDFPLEMNLVGRLIEQAQSRVEGHNFDIRKHLLEYDDVLNKQRAAIYEQRDRVFVKEDLTEDVTDMLRSELAQRVPQALEDEGGPWKLLSWLDSVQPPLNVTENQAFPSFTLRLLLDHLHSQLGEAPQPKEIKNALVELARQSLEAEKEHNLGGVLLLLENSQDRLKETLEERLEIADNYLDGLSDGDEAPQRRPQELVNELSATVGLPIKLSPEGVRALRENPRQARQEVRQLVEAGVTSQMVARLAGSVERRLEESLDLSAPLSADNWNALVQTLLDNVRSIYERRIQRNLGNEGGITQDVENAVRNLDGNLSAEKLEQFLLAALLMIPQSSRAAFDKRTHRRIVQRATRLSYSYYAARLLENQEPEMISDKVLAHLEDAQEAMRTAWGLAEWERLSGYRLEELGPEARQIFDAALEEAQVRVDYTQPLHSIEPSARQAAITALGNRALTAIYRQLLLSVISELWVDYLTQMEALRVSIGLESYAQRDPLVQYKNRAFDLYQMLLSNTRLSVISRMFIYRPREGTLSQPPNSRPTPARPASERPEKTAEKPAAAVQHPAAQPGKQTGGGKRKRHRRR